MQPPRKSPDPDKVDKDDDNVVRKELAKGEVRPDGPGDESAPVEPEPSPPRKP
jgi:hypothetical protein